MHRHSLLAAVSIAVSTGAGAHDLTYALRGSGDIRLAFKYQDGTQVAGGQAAIYGPDAGALPTATGVTDGAGELRIPGAADGTWRIDLSDSRGHAVRARVRVSDGVPALPERAVPGWLAAISLTLNAVLLLAASARRFLPRAATPRKSTRLREVAL